MSPAKVKLRGCELKPPALPVVPEEPIDELRKSIQGTATCLPAPDASDAEVADPMPVLLVAEVVELDDPAELELGVVLLALTFPLNEITANSSPPEFGLTIKSLMVPTSVPEDPVIWAPVS